MLRLSAQAQGENLANPMGNDVTNITNTSEFWG
jgi:hypothetical protein